MGGVLGSVGYDFQAARSRIMELTGLYRHAVRLGDELAQQELKALVDDLEQEVTAAHAVAGSKKAVGEDGL
ncbi:hypothetical protein ACFOQM_05865 [Paenibacillus sp. GCM10012307]|uniref:Uncharacterized protein n=1 Tax=Paenibacillus roseus TaxID=2798579 RepID=A0A934J016_9BACL|nr:hypothetical protein [Paenibacillus roseus]MBJ6360824.1 hypothetical protein [Paenibacillus roseus]